MAILATLNLLVHAKHIQEKSPYEVVLYIKDEGEGLPSQIMEHLGTPFITTKSGGTGLGLPVCYSIAARHNARIDYETQDSGTTFFIRFPLPKTN
jgi:signal transduction histidine kinase